MDEVPPEFTVSAILILSTLWFDTTNLEFDKPIDKQKTNIKTKISTAKTEKQPITKGPKKLAASKNETDTKEKEKNQNLSNNSKETKNTKSESKRTGWWSKSKNTE